MLISAPSTANGESSQPLVESQTDLPLDKEQFVCLTSSHPFHTTLNHGSLRFDKRVQLAGGGSGTQPTLQLHRSVEETSAPPALLPSKVPVGFGFSLNPIQR